MRASSPSHHTAAETPRQQTPEHPSPESWIQPFGAIPSLPKEPPRLHEIRQSVLCRPTNCSETWPSQAVFRLGRAQKSIAGEMFPAEIVQCFDHQPWFYLAYSLSQSVHVRLHEKRAIRALVKGCKRLRAELRQFKPRCFLSASG